jgi:hypothetical protein
VSGVGIEAQPTETWERLIKSHKPTLRADEMEEQVNKLVRRLVIPMEWYEMIMAYYLSNNGMADFERESYNLRQELSRYQDMYANGYVTQAQFKERAMMITKDLQKMKPSARAEAQVIQPLLKDFSTIWSQMTPSEQRAMLKTMFVALYFDGNAELKQVLANSPFDEFMATKKFST